jgi:UDP-GlcNAc:undecaprenyl-phosphate/decaprenyl-phosphate GlcNAc-1-phosphate transferase
VSAAASLLAFPAAALVVFGLLRSPATQRFVAPPREDRWHRRATPYFGGIGIFAGLAVGVGAALAAGAVPGSHEALLGILAGCTVLFGAGLLDDTFGLPPLAKIAAQLCAAAIVLSQGLSVSIVSNHWLALGLAVVWLVGMTNAFNMLDNMDGLAATLAAIASVFFAIDAATIHPNRTVLVLALSLLAACVGFLPFNLRAAGGASVFMGDSGSQVLGFTLAACGLAATLKIAQTTVSTLFLPLLILAVPILDTTLVTIVRLFEGRPIYQGGREHTTHRLVYHRLSDRRAVILHATISAALGATSLTYSVVDDAKITVIGVLLTFALIVQFASFLADVERNPSSIPERRPGLLRSVIVHRRRFVEVIVDGVLITASLYGAYVLRLGSDGTPSQRSYFFALLPVLLFARYLAFIPLGLYRGVWRYADARDAARVVIAVGVSEFAAFGFLSATRARGDFPRAILVIDVLLCTLLVGASRFWERAAYRGVVSLRAAGPRRRVIVVGAGRSGRSFARELRETPGEQIVGFVDDDPRLWRRRLQGVPVLGSADEMRHIVLEGQPDVVFIAIPGAPSERLDLVQNACAEAQVECLFVRREIDPAPLSADPAPTSNVRSIHSRGRG